MGQAIGQVIAFGFAVGLSPVPIIGVVLMLGTPRARSNGPAFLAGWVAGLVVVGTIVLLVSGGANASKQGQPVDWVNVVKLALGVALLALAAKQWRGRPRGGEQAPMPQWAQTIDQFTAGRSAALGVALSAVNPKNLVLVVGAATAIAQTGAAAADQAVALAVFVVIGTLGAGLPVLLYFVLGERSKPLLDDLKAWMSQHSAAIMTVLCLIIGAKLIGDAIVGFSS